MTRAYEVLADLIPDTDSWHEGRRSFLGASDIPAILGLDDYKTPLDVYRSKHGVPHVIDENRAYFGHALEPVIEGWLTRYRRDEVGYIGPGFAARSIAWPWLGCTTDRVASKDSEMRPIELKTSDAFAKRKWIDGVPLGYLAQVQAQHAVLGTTHGWLAVLHGGNTPELYPVDRDEEFIQDWLVPKTREFWQRHVVAHIPPDPVTSEEAVTLWAGDTTAEPVEADDVAFQQWDELRLVRARKAQAEAEEERLKLALQRRLGNATVLERDGTPLITWRPTVGRRNIDSKQLRLDHPDLAEAYTKRSDPGRQFLVKEPKQAKRAEQTVEAAA